MRAGSGRVAGNTITRDARPYRRTLRNAGAEETADAGAVVSDQVEASRTRIYTRSECGQKC